MFAPMDHVSWLYNTIQYKKHLDAPFPEGSERLQRKTLILQDKITLDIAAVTDGVPCRGDPKLTPD